MILQRQIRSGSVLPSQAEDILNRLSTDTVLDKFEDGVLITFGGRLIYCNNAIVEMTGYLRSEIIGLRPLDMVCENDVSRAEKRIQDLAKGAPEYPSEYRFKRFDGSQVPIRIFSRKLGDFDDGALVISVVQDLTPDKIAAKAARESQHKYNVIFESSSDALLIIDTAEGRIVEANSAAGVLLEAPADTLSQMTLTELWQKTGLVETMARENRRRKFLLRQNSDGANLSEELVIETVFSPFVMDDRQMALVTLRDVTIQHQEEIRRKIREERFRLAIEAGKVGIWEWDLRSSHFFLDSNLKAMLGYADDELNSCLDVWMDQVYEDDRPKFNEHIERHIAEETTHFEFEQRVMHRAGYFCWFLVRGHAIRNEEGSVLKVIGSHTDISHQKKVEEELTIHRNLLEDLVEVRTLKLRSMNQELQKEIQEHRRTENALKQSRQQLRDFSARLQAAIEEERTRIAKDLHDELGQELSILQMNMAMIEKMLPAGSEKLAEKVTGMTTLTGVALKKVREIAQELRPSVLDNLGFSAAIEWQSQDFTRKTGIECNVECQPEEIVLDRQRSSALFRVFQEALTNVLRHAQAKKIDVKIACKEEIFLMTVKDDGRGITPDETSNPNSLGLLGMRERIHPFDGIIHIKGKKGKGTVLKIEVPLAESVGETE